MVIIKDKDRFLHDWYWYFLLISKIYDNSTQIYQSLTSYIYNMQHILGQKVMKLKIYFYHTHDEIKATLG